MCLSFSFTSSTIFELMLVLKRNNVDWNEHLAVQNYYSKKSNDAVEEVSQPFLLSIINPLNNTPASNPLNNTIDHHQTNSSPIILRQLFSVDNEFSNDTTNSNINLGTNSRNKNKNMLIIVLCAHILTT